MLSDTYRSLCNTTLRFRAPSRFPSRHPRLFAHPRFSGRKRVATSVRTPAAFALWKRGKWSHPRTDAKIQLALYPQALAPNITCLWPCCWQMRILFAIEQQCSLRQHLGNRRGEACQPPSSSHWRAGGAALPFKPPWLHRRLGRGPSTT